MSREPSIDAPTAAALGVLVYALAIGLHEVGHAVVMAAVGGDPELLTSTDVRGNLDGVPALGILAIGAAGSAVNLLLALVGRGMARAAGGFGIFGWLLMSVNLLIPSFYLLISPVAGFGDWTTVLRAFDAPWSLRAALALVGAGLLALSVRAVRSGLDRLGGSDLEARRALGLHPWLAGGALALAAALFSPLPALWALPVAAGSTLGTTCALPIVADGGAGMPRGSGVLRRERRIWLLAAAVGIGFVLLLGPGSRI